MAPGAMTGMSAMLGNLDLAGIGSGISAFGQIGGGIASFSQGKSNASMLRKLGVISAEEERVRTRRILGAQQSAAAASGIDPTSGSALDVQGDTALEGEIAALMAKFDYDAQAAVVEGEATESLISGFQNASSTILGTQLDKLGQNPRTREGLFGLNPEKRDTSHKGRKRAVGTTGRDGVYRRDRKARARNIKPSDYSGYA